MTRTTTIAIAIAVLALGARRAAADVERYALIVGNDGGDVDEERLRFAGDDAQRVYDVLRDLGGFRAEDMLLLRGEDADTVRRGLISLNDRIRTQTSGDSELFVYYSGHGDQRALHLGKTTLETRELEQLVRGSSATLRLLVLDSCRSGGLTHVKGGRIAPAFPIALDERAPGDGLIFWTASSESESAQESDELRGSFFTHFLVSGLLGAADLDGDGAVTLDEAYAYAYENTLRATSRTLAGEQHPTFHYELGGEGKVVLSRPGRATGERAQLRFPAGMSYLLIAGGGDGAVVAEVGAHDRTRALSVKPGRYFVRGRGEDYLLEGTVTLAAGDDHAISARELDRVDYARLVRKGRSPVGHADSLQLGYAVRGPLWSGAGACQGPLVGAAIELRTITIAPRVGACHGAFANDFLRARTDELELEVRATHAWDAGPFTLDAGVDAGASWLRQAFTATGIAPPRDAAAAHVGVTVGASVDLVQGFYVGAELDGMSYLFDQQTMTGAHLATPFALRLSVVLLGARW